jgi:ribonuclease HI
VVAARDKGAVAVAFPIMTLEETLIAQEKSLHDPTVRADSEAVSRLLSPDFFEFGASGRVWSREAIFAQLATENPAEITSRDYTCQTLSPDVTLLTYISETPTRRVLRSSLWRLEGEHWRLVFHQGTPIP